MKLALRAPKESTNAAYAWETCLPFVENKRGTLIHRPVEVLRYKGRRHTYLAAPQNGKLVCQKCEAAAVAAHLPSSDALCGMHVHKGTTKPVQTCCEKEPRP